MQIDVERPMALTEASPDAKNPGHHSAPIHAVFVPIQRTRVSDVEVRYFPVLLANEPANSSLVLGMGRGGE